MMFKSLQDISNEFGFELAKGLSEDEILFFILPRHIFPQDLSPLHRSLLVCSRLGSFLLEVFSFLMADQF